MCLLLWTCILLSPHRFAYILHLIMCMWSCLQPARFVLLLPSDVWHQREISSWDEEGKGAVTQPDEGNVKITTGKCQSIYSNYNTHEKWSIHYVQKGQNRAMLTSPQQVHHQMEVLELSLAEKTAECSSLRGSPLLKETYYNTPLLN